MPDLPFVILVVEHVQSYANLFGGSHDRAACERFDPRGIGMNCSRIMLHDCRQQSPATKFAPVIPCPKYLRVLSASYRSKQPV